MSPYDLEFANLNTVTACLEKRDQLASCGEFEEIKNDLKTASAEQKKLLGAKLNHLRQALNQAADSRIQLIQREQEKDEFTNFDPTFYSPYYKDSKNKSGSIHPLSLVVREIVDIFGRLGFDVYDSDLVESQWYNFTSVNIPDYHPARGMQDTFFLEQKDEDGQNYVMRTQVTSNAVKYTQSHAAPFRVIFPGLVFRAEDIDATHDINFTQFDMWLVDKQATVSQLVTLVQHFFSVFFKDPDLKVRLRQSYFPFTLPSMEGDISCPYCHGQGCRICKKTGWIEVFGAGPIHPKVIENMGLESTEWQGIAFGFGIDRLAQLKFKLTGISQFYNGHLEFLKGRGKLD
jgi:phenylalanyl-tRNA synthetase alpha chain